jgi:succinate dehydrogenase / fumarate reductase iron-sulfur subunit
MSHILVVEETEPVEIGEPITADVYRFDPSSDIEPRVERYTVPYHHRMSVFTLLREIYARQDQTLAFRNQQCGRGICGTCRVRLQINGGEEKSLKGCTIPLEPGWHVVIKPYRENRVIRDLVVDF